MNNLPAGFPSEWFSLFAVYLPFGIGIVIAIAATVIILVWQNRQAPQEPRLQTDEGNIFTVPADFKSPKPTHPVVPATRTDAERGEREFVRRADTDYNCMGHAFGRARWEIETGRMDLILDDNYQRVEPEAVEVGCIIVWYGPGGAFAHVGLVVEVPGGGNPVTARSKDGTSSYVYDHSPGEVPGAPAFGFFRRRSTDGLSAVGKRRLATAESLYAQVKDKSTPEAHPLAEMLGQERNALISA